MNSSEILIKIHENAYENIVCEKAAILSRGDVFNQNHIYNSCRAQTISGPRNGHVGLQTYGKLKKFLADFNDIVR